MNPKDKAMQLFNSFEADLMEADVYYLDYAKKRCALIAVDELIKLYEYENPHRGFKISYWDDVKEEIEKL
jgi:hypothetical protein